MPLPVTGVVIARDEADRIARCVRSLLPACTEVVVLDSGSGDATVAVARAAGARVEVQSWLGFSAQKNAAIAQAREPWVLLLDADEWLTVAAQRAMAALFTGAARVEGADVWRLQRRTHFLGTPLRFGGWGREPVDRLFRRDLRYLEADVHERLGLEGRRVPGRGIGMGLRRCVVGDTRRRRGALECAPAPGQGRIPRHGHGSPP